MTKENKRTILGLLLLLGATIAWGSSFLILKNTIENLPPIYVIGIRFLAASILLGLIFYKKVFKINKEFLKHSFILGFVLFMAYFTQTYGLKYTTPSQNAFVTSLYCIICPFLLWPINKVKPKSYNIISVVLCMIGIGIISFSRESQASNDKLALGIILTAISAFFYAFQLIFIDRYKDKHDTMLLLIYELFFASVLLLLYSAIFEINQFGIKKFALDKEQLYNIIYLTLACTLFAQFAQMFGQKMTTPNQAAVILCLESVFGALFSIIFGTEIITTLIGSGFAIIFIGVLISELKLDPLKLIKRKKYNDKN